MGLARSAGIVSFFTLLSRILGLIRDMVIAHVFGTGIAADAFFVAFRIPNLLRRLFAEGSLTIAFIPVFSDYLVNRGKQEAFSLARILASSLILVLLLVTALGIIFSPFIVKITAYGFKEGTTKFHLAVLLTRVMFPYIFFISLVAFYMGLLNSLGHFSAPAAAPILLNLSMVASAYLISPLFQEPIVGLAVGVLMGGLVQLLLQVPFSRKLGFKFRFQLDPLHPGLKAILQLMLPTIFGSAVYQLNQLIGTLLASFLRDGSVSWLYYADRLVQFPLGLFGVALGTVALPSLSSHYAKSDHEAFSNTLIKALRILIFISIPSTFGLLALGEPIVRLFFERGRFSTLDTAMTSSALWAYGIGLLAFSQIRVLVAGFFAMKDTKTPVYMATLALFLNTGLGLILMGPMEHTGLALALSISSTLQALLLLGILWRRLKARPGLHTLLSTFLKSMASSIVMAAFLRLVSTYWAPNASSTLLLIKVFSLVLSGSILYLLISFLLKAEELKFLRI